MIGQEDAFHLYIILFLNCSELFRNYVCNDSNINEIMQNFAKVTIYNKHMYVTRIEEVASYSLDQLFSDIGYCCSFSIEDDLRAGILSFVYMNSAVFLRKLLIVF